MNCENCNVEHEGSYASGRFCTKKCSHSYATKAKRKEINIKVSKKMSIRKEKRTCVCGNDFIINPKKTQRFCSRRCGYDNYKYKDPKSASHRSSKLAFSRHQNNDTSFGWQSRNKLQPSYPEQYVMTMLDNLNVKYIWEHKVGKYFIDIAIDNIALEIDGKQHELRKDKDDEKDEYLSNEGWLVFRLRWFNPKTSNGKRKILEQFNEFISRYDLCGNDT